MNATVSFVDWVIIYAYLISVVALGIAAGCIQRKGARGGEGGDYFLAGNTLTWPVIGLAMFAANISTVHLVSLAEAAYKYGLVYGSFEWMGGFTLILLSLFFAPLYLRSQVTTLPDFLEIRFDRSCRDILSIVSLFSAIVLHMGVALYTAAWVLRGILGMPPTATIVGIDALLFFIIVLGLLTGVYTMVGGLLAVVWTESLQTVLLLAGAVAVTVACYIKVGGWSNLTATLASQPHPLAEVPGSGVTWATTNFLRIARPAGDPSGLAWYSIFLGYPVIGIWYWCCDQTIVQRVLAAKNQQHSRWGPLFCAFLKIFPVFFFVLPGVMCAALVQQNAFQGAAPATAGDTYTFLLTRVLPVGLKGLVIAAMLAAAMQTCSAALNSTATLVAYDIFRRYRPDLSESHLVMIGKSTTVAATLLAIVASPLFGTYSTIYEGLSRLISYIAPPITAVFLLGVFWSRPSGRAAFVTLVVGLVAGCAAFWADLSGIYRGDFMLIAFLFFALCVAVMLTATLLFPAPLKPEAHTLVWEHWLEPLRSPSGAGLADHRAIAAVLCVVLAALYLAFW